MNASGQVPDSAEATEVARLFAGSRELQSSRTVVSTLPRVPDYSRQVILLGRLKPGTALESRRVVHVFQLMPDLLHNTELHARCDATLPVRDIEWLPGLAGMPCEQCVMRSLAERQMV